MHIDDEIAGTEEMIALDRANALEVLARRATELKLDAKTLGHYKNFIDACLSSAASTLATCRAIAAMHDVPPHVATQVIAPFLLRAHEATHSMFLGMLVVEHVAEAAQGVSNQRTTAEAPKPEPQHTCSFCGKTESETALVAGPTGNICASCTRLAATVHGIGLAD